MLGNQAKAISP